MARFFKNCLHPGCTKRGDFCRGFCGHHYLIFRKHCKENGSWGNANPLPRPIVIEHWEWEGSEDELAAMCEEQQRLKALKGQQEQNEP